MADLSLPVSFDLIEGHKENIQPLAAGRSARALVAALNSSTTPHGQRSEHAEIRAKFEEELLGAPELDDPLEVWVRYINWTIEAYPSGHNTESGLLHLLERATKQFLHEQHYKNDPRYLRFWIYYIQHFSEAPREHFSYLARNDIGQRLAMFYEEFAALLETLGRKKQAREIYQLGIENNARPVERLLRKYDEFAKRYEANPPAEDEPSSPALPTVRPALATKSLPFGTGDGGPYPDPQSQPIGIPPQPRPARQKMTIFSDADNPDKALSQTFPGSGPAWDSIGTLEHRKKENIIEPRPWAGETLKQQGGVKQIAGEKLSIFRDTSNAPPEFPTQAAAAAAAVPGKRPERIVANLHAIYTKEDDPTHEYSFEELRAMKRGLYSINWKQRRAEQVAELKRCNQRSSVEAFADITGSPPRPKTQTIQAKLDSPSPGKGKLKKRKMVRSEPTMTLHTKAATDEIYDILNQPIDQPSKDLDEESDSYDGSDQDPDDVTGMSNVSRVNGEGSESGSDSGDDDDRSEWSDSTRKGIEYLDETVGLTDDTFFQKFDKQIRAEQDEDDEDEDDEDDDEPGQPIQPRKLFSVATDSPPGEQSDENYELPDVRTRRKQFTDRSRMYMTPIAEQTEVSLPSTTARRKAAAKTPSRTKAPPPKGGKQQKIQTLHDSSPFQEDLADEDFLPPPPKLDLNAVPVSVPISGPKKELPLGTKKSAATVKEKHTGPVTADTQVNPMDPDLRDLIISRLTPALNTYEGFFEYKEVVSGKAEVIKKQLKPPSKKEVGAVEKAVLVSFPGGGGRSYTFKRQIGEGAFAPIYLVENNTIAEHNARNNDRNDENAPSLPPHLHRRELQEAIKFTWEPPVTPWEFYIMRQIHRRLGVSRPTDSILHALECHLYGKESFLVLPYHKQGTLIDLMNLCAKEALAAKGTPGQGVDEMLAMFLSIELLRTMEALHSKGILHGDLKADNCLVRFEPVAGGDAKWESAYRRDGSGGWAKKGITLIDFGRGIDMRQFVPNVQFIADWKADPQQDCAEMREMRPWTYQIDYHGAAGIIHGLLFGKYMETVAEKTGTVGVGGGGGKGWKVKEPFKRYWQGEIWGKCFEMLLNPGRFAAQEDPPGGGAGGLPIIKAIRGVREEMEAWLEQNSEKGVGLKNLIRRLEPLVAAGAAEGKKK